MEHVNCVIIGSGPAGYTAAIYAARAGLKPIMYTGMPMGGQLMITTEVENFPGYPEGVQGPELMEDLRKQAERFGTIIRYSTVEKVELNAIPKLLTIDDETQITADAVIISTGASAKWLGIPSEQRLMNMGVSACAVCDGFFFKNKPVAIVGAGDTAAEEALYLSKLCTSVQMIVRSDKMRASKIMQERLLNTPNITIHFNSSTDEILGENKVQAVRILNSKTNEKTELEVAALFIAIGHKPNTDIFKGQLEMDENGYLFTIGKSSKTNIPGVFASGDCQDYTYRQAVTAAGSGCMAALDAERWLGENGH